MAAAGHFRDRPDEFAPRHGELRVIPLKFDEWTRREEGLDKTVADSFPASDPPSSIPNPYGETL